MTHTDLQALRERNQAWIDAPHTSNGQHKDSQTILQLLDLLDESEAAFRLARGLYKRYEDLLERERLAAKRLEEGRATENSS